MNSMNNHDGLSSRIQDDVNYVCVVNYSKTYFVESHYLPLSCGVFTFVVCGRRIEELSTEIRSPNYPSTPYIAPDQYDENPQCYWNMRPADPNVSSIWITFKDFLIGRRQDWGGCRYILAFICKRNFVSYFSEIFRHQQVWHLTGAFHPTKNPKFRNSDKK